MLWIVSILLWTVHLLVRTTLASTDNHESLLQLDLTLSQSREELQSKHISKRNDSLAISTNSVDNFLSITVNASIGTPAQSLRLVVDTGSADLIILSATNTACPVSCELGSYNMNTSTTHVANSSIFHSVYADGTAASGIHVTDTMSIGDISLKNLQFGLSQNSSSSQSTQLNILGLGYAGIESKGNGTTYANLPLRLYIDGAIDIVGYSIWFDGPDKTTGKLALGSIDTGKFSGPLETLPIALDTSSLSYTFATIKLAGMSASRNGTFTNFTGSSIPVLLDSGSTPLLLPSSLVQQIAQTIGAEIDEVLGAPVMRKSAYKNDTSFILVLGGTSVEIPIDHLVYPLNDTTIAFMIMISEDVHVLGIPFFRNTLVVFDYSHNQVSLAPSIPSSASNLTKISQNGVFGLVGTVPGSLKQSNGTISLPTGSSPTLSDAQTSRQGLKVMERIGIGVGAGVGVPIITAIVLGAFLVHRRIHSKEREPSLAVKDFEMNEHDKAELSGTSAASTFREKAELSTAAQRHEIDSRNVVPIELPGCMPPTHEMSTERRKSRI